MVALAAGADRWRQVDLPAFEAQASLSRGFWMSYHELTGGYPWLTKRVARVLHPDAALPSRNGFAHVLALVSPDVGRGGGAIGIVALAAVIGHGDLALRGRRRRAGGAAAGALPRGRRPGREVARRRFVPHPRMTVSVRFRDPP